MVRHHLIAASMIVTLAAPLMADDARVKELKAKVAEAEKKLAELKAELAKEEEPKEFKRVHGIQLENTPPEIGDEGPLPMYPHKVEEIIDDDTFVLRLRYDKAAGPVFIVRGVSTKGWADDRLMNSKGAFRVVGTEKRGRQTLYVLRPADGKFEVVK